MSKREKKHPGLAKKILCGILAVIVAFFAVTTCITVIGYKSNNKKAQSFPTVGCDLNFENVSNGVWNIYSDKDLKIVQITDIHIGGGWLSISKDGKALNAVAAMLSEEKPDLVIATGDISYPVPFQSGTLNNKTAAKLFATLMEQLGIYWVGCYGNHDTEAYSYYSREDITELYSSDEYPHCLIQAGPEDVDGSGNQIFNIVNSDGIITRTLYILDSHSYIDGDIFGAMWKYDNMHENQIEWYKTNVLATNEKNKETLASLSEEAKAKYENLDEVVPSSVFFHIPMSEYEDAWYEYLDNGRQDTENVKLNYGTAGETNNGVFCGIHEDNFFETMLELGSTDSVFCGHDHLNGFSVNYKGINLTYGQSIDYLAYIGISKKGSQRGCTVLNISADGSLEFHPENYYQDKYVSYYEKEEVTMQELAVEGKREK